MDGGDRRRAAAEDLRRRQRLMDFVHVADIARANMLAATRRR
jgi:hypothetical protein